MRRDSRCRTAIDERNSSRFTGFGEFKPLDRLARSGC
jgi:hypothetical protein